MRHAGVYALVVALFTVVTGCGPAPVEPEQQVVAEPVDTGYMWPGEDFTHPEYLYVRRDFVDRPWAKVFVHGSQQRRMPYPKPISRSDAYPETGTVPDHLASIQAALKQLHPFLVQIEAVNRRLDEEHLPPGSPIVSLVYAPRRDGNWETPPEAKARDRELHELGLRLDTAWFNAAMTLRDAYHEAEVVSKVYINEQTLAARTDKVDINEIYSPEFLNQSRRLAQNLKNGWTAAMTRNPERTDFYLREVVYTLKQMRDQVPNRKPSAADLHRLYWPNEDLRKVDTERPNQPPHIPTAVEWPKVNDSDMPPEEGVQSLD